MLRKMLVGTRALMQKHGEYLCPLVSRGCGVHRRISVDWRHSTKKGLTLQPLPRTECFSAAGYPRVPPPAGSNHSPLLVAVGIAPVEAPLAAIAVSTSCVASCLAGMLHVPSPDSTSCRLYLDRRLCSWRPVPRWWRCKRSTNQCNRGDHRQYRSHGFHSFHFKRRPIWALPLHSKGRSHAGTGARKSEVAVTAHIPPGRSHSVLEQGSPLPCHPRFFHQRQYSAGYMLFFQ